MWKRCRSLSSSPIPGVCSAPMLWHFPRPCGRCAVSFIPFDCDFLLIFYFLQVQCIFQRRRSATVIVRIPCCRWRRWRRPNTTTYRLRSCTSTTPCCRFANSFESMKIHSYEMKWHGKNDIHLIRAIEQMLGARTRNHGIHVFGAEPRFRRLILDILNIWHMITAVLRITIFIYFVRHELRQSFPIKTTCKCCVFPISVISIIIFSNNFLLRCRILCVRKGKQCNRSSNACPTSDTVLPTHLFIGPRAFPHIFIRFSQIANFISAFFLLRSACSISLCECLFCLRILAAQS